ncbi:hypothetical protein ColKHC_12310 [Colletotrichum higginsianum]|nr:hypothetical protein ColKHC_12310 [Colletotrichum higginsianum]
MRLRAELPPRTLPRLTVKIRPLTWGWATVVKFQSYLVPSVDPFMPGTLIFGSSQAAGPASMRRMLEAGSPSLRRAATATPAVPPPTTICGEERKDCDEKGAANASAAEARHSDVVHENALVSGRATQQISLSSAPARL